MLDLAGVPVLAKDRTELTTLVIAGGQCACNPEPMDDFFDLFILGEGEEVNVELLELYERMKPLKPTKQEFLREAAKLEGVYVPSFFDVDYLSERHNKTLRVIYLIKILYNTLFDPSRCLRDVWRDRLHSTVLIVIHVIERRNKVPL